MKFVSLVAAFAAIVASSIMVPASLAADVEVKTMLDRVDLACGCSLFATMPTGTHVKAASPASLIKRSPRPSRIGKRKEKKGRSSLPTPAPLSSPSAYPTAVASASPTPAPTTGIDPATSRCFQLPGLFSDKRLMCDVLTNAIVFVDRPPQSGDRCGCCNLLNYRQSQDCSIAVLNHLDAPNFPLETVDALCCPKS